MKLSTKDMILSSFFAALTIVGAKINFLLPDIPLTFQPIMVMLAGSLSGSKAAMLSQIVYVAMGLIGIPVFAKPIAGPAYVLQPSFGYLIGYIFASYIIGKIIELNIKRSIYTFVIANMIGLALIYLFGLSYMYGLMNFYLGKKIGIIKVIASGMTPFIVKDIILGLGISVISFNIYTRITSQLHSTN